MSTGVIFSRKYIKKKPLLKLPSVDQKGREHAKYDLRQKKKEKKGLRGKKGTVLFAYCSFQTLNSDH